MLITGLWPSGSSKFVCMTNRESVSVHTCTHRFTSTYNHTICETRQIHDTRQALWEAGLRLLFSINHDCFAVVLEDAQQRYPTSTWCLVYDVAAANQQVLHISPTGTLLAALLGWLHGVARYARALLSLLKEPPIKEQQCAVQVLVECAPEVFYRRGAAGSRVVVLG